jgi:hypothetical protein
VGVSHLIIPAKYYYTCQSSESSVSAKKHRKLNGGKGLSDHKSIVKPLERFIQLTSKLKSETKQTD